MSARFGSLPSRCRSRMLAIDEGPPSVYGLLVQRPARRCHIPWREVLDMNPTPSAAAPEVCIRAAPTRAVLAAGPAEAAALVDAALTLDDPRARFTYAVRRGHGDGRVHFFRRPSQSFPAGLLPLVLQTLTEGGYAP